MHEKQKGRIAALLVNPVSVDSALARLETGVALADHEDLATTAHHLAVAVTGLCGLQRIQDFHGDASKVRTDKRGIVSAETVDRKRAWTSIPGPPVSAAAPARSNRRDRCRESASAAGNSCIRGCSSDPPPPR